MHRFAHTIALGHCYSYCFFNYINDCYNIIRKILLRIDCAKVHIKVLKGTAQVS